MHECLLVPLDGSEAAAAALAYAELIPSRRVRLLRVEPDTVGPMLAGADELTAWRAAQETEGRSALEAVAGPLRRQGRRVETAFVIGDPATAIVAAAGDCDLVVMTTHGRGAGGRALFGSVADRVVRHSPVATLVVRGGDHPAALPPLTRLVVPLDGSPAAEQALPLATRLANDLGVPVHLIRVVAPDAVRDALRAGAVVRSAVAAAHEAARREAEVYRSTQERTLRNRDIPVSGEVRLGLPADELLEAVGTGDLVVMTTHGHGGLRRWLLGSVADKLVRAAPAPVLLVRAKADGSHAADPP